MIETEDNSSKSLLPDGRILHESIQSNEKQKLQNNPSIIHTSIPLKEKVSIKETSNNFLNWLNKFVSVLIIFILIGCGFGIYISKFIYDMRLKEITTVGGFVYEQKIYDVKIRP